MKSNGHLVEASFLAWSLSNSVQCARTLHQRTPQFTHLAQKNDLDSIRAFVGSEHLKLSGSQCHLNLLSPGLFTPTSSKTQAPGSKSFVDSVYAFSFLDTLMLSARFEVVPRESSVSLRLIVFFAPSLFT